MIAAMSSKLAAVHGEAQARKPFRRELELDWRAAKTVDEEETGAAFAEHKAAIDDRHRVLRRFGLSCMMDSTLADPAADLVEHRARAFDLGGGGGADVGVGVSLGLRRCAAPGRNACGHVRDRPSAPRRPANRPSPCRE